jgi:thiol-disulfide isomerase/thioredoxin
MRRTSRTIALAVSLLSLGIGPGRADPPPPEKEKADEAPKGALVSPGPDAEKVVAFLKRIKEGRTTAERACGDMLIRGRVSRVQAEWKEGMAEPTPEKLPAPEWCQFLLVHKGDKRRYDVHYVNDLPGSEFLATAYRIMDGKAFYSLNGPELEIHDRDAGKWRWETLAGGYFRCGHVHDGLKDGPVDVVCQTLIDRITQGKDGKDADWWKGRVLRCYEENSLLVVENDDNPARKSRCRYRFWVDPKHGYHVVRTQNEQGRHRDESQVELTEAAPGVFMPKQATEFIAEPGRGAARVDMRVDVMRVGDVKYASELFELASLPVPKDVRVTDHRNGRVVVSGGTSVDIEAALLAAGKPAPPFEVPLLDRGGFKSRDVLGAKKHLLATFWSCQCPPCAAELAYLSEIHGDLQRAGVEVVAVNLGDESEEVRKSSRTGA